MIIPIRTDYRMTRTPWVNYALLAINIGVYFMGYHGGSASGMSRIYGWMLHPDNPNLEQFFSSVFLHGSFWHLAGNMLFLWVFGNAINDRFGHAGYLAFYLAGGVLAGIGYVLLAGGAPVLGASGAISAVTGAYLVLLPRSQVTVLALLVYVLMPFEVSSLYFLLFQLLINLWMSFSPGITGNQAAGVAYAAHSSGYVFGIAVSAALLALRVLPRDSFDLLNLIKSHHRRARYQRMVAQGYDPFSYTGRRQGEPSRWVGSRTVGAETGEMGEARELTLRREISQAIDRHDLPTAAARYLQLVQLAEDPVLSRPQQLDIANHLMAAEQHSVAADAYERFLKHYDDYEYVGDIYLMLGLLYGRYLHQYGQAEQNLQRALDRLEEPRKLELARNEMVAVRRRREG